jgi:hypothetical protein
MGKIYYPYPTRRISGTQPDRIHGWDFKPVSMSTGYETRVYLYPRVQLPSLMLGSQDSISESAEGEAE